MHMVREIIEVGKYKFKVYDTFGKLLIITENPDIARRYYTAGKEKEEKDAKLRRNAVSSRPSNTNAV